MFASVGTTPRPTDSKPLGVVEPELVSPAETTLDDPNATEQALSRLNDRLKQIHDALPARTVFIIMTGNGDPRPVIRLNAKKKSFDFKYKKLGESGAQKLPLEEKWTTQDETDLEEAVMGARMGMAFFCVKNPPLGK
jgi:RNA exonuclease 1